MFLPVRILVPACVFLLGLVAFAPSLGNDYVLDDIAQVRFIRLPAPTLESWGLAASQRWWARPTWTAWRPVTRIAILAEKTVATRRLGTSSAWPYHAVSLGLHALTSLLVVVLARRVGLAWAAAGAAGAIVAVHPLRSEAVHQIVGQAEVLAALFMTAGAASFARARRCGDGFLRVALTQAVFYGLALGAKEHAAIYPVFLLLVEAALRPRVAVRPGARTLVATFASLALVAGFFLWGKAVFAGGILQPPGTVSEVENPLAVLSFVERIPGSFGLLGYVVTRVFFPFGLSPDYSAESLPVHLGWSWPMAWLGLTTAVAALVYGAVDVRRGGRGWLIVLAALAAWGFVSNLVFVHGTLFALRLLYLPMIPVALGLGAVWAVARESAARRRGVTWLPDGALAFFLTILVLSTWAFAPAWKTEIGFARATLERFPRSWRANHNLAALLGRRGEFEEGLRHALVAAGLRPDHASTWNSVAATALEVEGHEQQAEDAARRSIELSPRFPPPWEHLARALLARGEEAEALEAYEEYLRLAPSQRRRLAPELRRLRENSL